MNKRFWLVVLAVTLVGSVAGCANQKAPPLESFQPVPVNPSAPFQEVRYLRCGSGHRLLDGAIVSETS